MQFKLVMNTYSMKHQKYTAISMIGCWDQNLDKLSLPKQSLLQQQKCCGNDIDNYYYYYYHYHHYLLLLLLLLLLLHNSSSNGGGGSSSRSSSYCCCTSSKIFVIVRNEWQLLREREREMFYLTTHSTHFIYSYMASHIWVRTILIVRKETRCHHIGYSYRLTARVLLYAPSHRQDNTYHGLCYTSRGALAGTRNISMGPPHE